uniref:C-type lectin domain-containing protein n=1 Tax=Anolis carolinensis TaxID=28377 RepID=A0A803TGW5_ANOCA
MRWSPGLIPPLVLLFCPPDLPSPSLPIFAEVESCDRGWLSYRGFCYGFFQERKTWAEAEVDCISMGGHLASIHSSEESDRVAKYIASYSQSNKNVWIGMHVPTGVSGPLSLWVAMASHSLYIYHLYMRGRITGGDLYFKIPASVSVVRDFCVVVPFLR